MRHKTSELKGALLDAAVAKAAGWTGIVGVAGRPSTSWQAAGPLIHRARIVLAPQVGHPSWGAHIQVDRPARDGQVFIGPTPLIAAMRAFVGCKLGGEVELP